MLLHYGEFFCDSCHHNCGEMEDIQHTQKVRQQGFKDMANHHRDLISKVEQLNQRRKKGEDIDLIFYHINDSVRLIHSDISDNSNLGENDLIRNFKEKLRMRCAELKSLKAEIEGMYRINDYYGIYK